MAGCDASRQGFGEHSFELVPAYGALVDTMHSAGFTEMVELAGESTCETMRYTTLLKRCLIGFKSDPAP